MTENEAFLWREHPRLHAAGWTVNVLWPSLLSLAIVLAVLEARGVFRAAYLAGVEAAIGALFLMAGAVLALGLSIVVWEARILRARGKAA